jgi:6-phosphogluconate dehydrogenase
VRSWLLDLMVKALEKNPTSRDVSDYTADSGEGRGRSRRPSPRRADAGHLGLALRPVRLAPGDQPDDAGGRGAARQFGGHQVMTIAEGDALRGREKAQAAPPPRSKAASTRPVSPPKKILPAAKRRDEALCELRRPPASKAARTRRPDA